MPSLWTWSAHVLGRSTKFHSPDADITYKSSDGVTFRIHSIYLKAHTEILAPPDGFSLAEVVNLPEDAETLEYLFQFIYPMPQPDLRALRLGVVQKVAEAAEKYGVYPAKSRCNTVMQECVNQSPYPVLMYAMRHEYDDLMDRAALLHLKQPVELGIRGMSEHCSVTWIRYHATWDAIRREIQIKFCRLPVQQFSSSHWQILKRLHSDLTWIQHLALNPSAWPKQISELISQVEMGAMLRNEQPRIREQVKQIPAFSEFRKLPHAVHIPEQPLILEEPIKHFPNPFNDEPVIFRSSDGSRFSISPQMLKASGDGFPTPKDKQMEVVLEEDSFTLDLILQFVHNMAQPDLSSLDFEHLEPLSMAAHKYRVHYATSVIKEHLRKFAVTECIHLLIHAFRIEDFELLDLATYGVLDACPKEVVMALPDDLVIIWTEYYALWRKATDKTFDNLLRLLPRGPLHSSCYNCRKCDQAEICLLRLGEGVAGFRRLRAGWELERNTELDISRAETNVPSGPCHSWVGPVYELTMRHIEPFSNVVKRAKGYPTFWTDVGAGLQSAHIFFKNIQYGVRGQQNKY